MVFVAVVVVQGRGSVCACGGGDGGGDGVCLCVCGGGECVCVWRGGTGRHSSHTWVPTANQLHKAMASCGIGPRTYFCSPPKTRIL